MKFFTLSLLLLIVIPAHLAQESKWKESAVRFQDSLNARFLSPETSILLKKDQKGFKGLDFYPIDMSYRVEARFVRTPDEKPFKMPTTTSRKPLYVKYGEAFFSLKGVECKLNIYKSIESLEGGPYADFVFVPFTDLTTGDGTYGGGRYAYILNPVEDKLVIDFNQVFNPYCAYSPLYSCPIVPRENDLAVRIEAGVKAFKK